MRNPLALAGALLLVASAVSSTALASNPFLSAADDKPVAAKFTGTEWSDDSTGGKDLPLSAKVVTTRIATAPWGSVFRISFENIASRATPPRELLPVYYIVSDNEIVLLNEQDNEAAARKLAAEPKPPVFEPGDVQGISKGTRQSQDKLTETKITIKGDRCPYEWSHNSGHFTTVVWQKGVGLIEYAQGRGAHADGYRLKRESARKKR